MPSREHWQRLVATAHLRSIARRKHIHIRWIKGRNWHNGAEAFGVTQTVFIPRPYNARQYLVGLHELGHLLGALPLWDGNSDRATLLDITGGPYVLLEETAAWAWAIEHIHPALYRLIERTDLDATMGRGLASHGWSVYTAHDG